MIVLVLFIIMLHFPPMFFSLPLLLCALAGNVLNLMALVDCLRELSGESLFAACFILLSQLLWILYALLIAFADF
jgi:hypothetical protein